MNICQRDNLRFVLRLWSHQMEMTVLGINTYTYKIWSHETGKFFKDFSSGVVLNVVLVKGLGSVEPL